MKFADFHQDTLNPYLVEILNKENLGHARERAKQLPKNGLQKVDIIFSSVYRRMNEEEEKEAAKQGGFVLVDDIKKDELKLIDYYKNTKDFKIILSVIAEKLSEQGNFSDDEIAKIMYGNIERIVKKL